MLGRNENEDEQMTAENPYRTPPDVSVERFEVRSSLGMAVRFAGVGFFFALLSGLWLEIYVSPSSAFSMAVPGMGFGLGLSTAILLFRPQKKIPAVFLAPVIGVVGFAIIGFMYDNNAALVAGFGRSLAGYLKGWFVLGVASLPGVLSLSLVCALCGRPRSQARLMLFLVVTAALAGAAPLITANVTATGRFFATMVTAQLIMFAATGWIVGDSKLEADDEDLGGRL